MLKPEFWWDEKIDELTDTEALAYAALWNFCDDEGRHRYNPRELEKEIPRSSFRDRWDEFLTTFKEKGFIVVYEVGGNKYFHIRTWHRHQKINRPTLSDLPAPPEGDPIREHALEKRRAVVPFTEGIPYDDILDLWNKTMGRWCPNIKFDPKSQVLLLIRSTWLSHQERQKLSWWKELFLYMGKSAFLRGEKIAFCARLDWSLVPENLNKILSGRYHDEDRKERIKRRFANRGND